MKNRDKNIYFVELLRGLKGESVQNAHYSIQHTVGTYKIIHEGGPSQPEFAKVLF